MIQWSDRRSLITGVVLLAAVMFLLGINWGLPSRAVDRQLFGSEPVWSGERIYILAGGWDDADIGADVDRTPLGDITGPILLNGTDRERAQIIRRYRLYSYQPDEMITFRALAQMKPAQGRFDPKLYQYGGLWIYPVGAMIRIASIIRIVELTPELMYYLDHPEAFGRMYVVARLYTVLWGLVGAFAVFWIVDRLTRDTLIGCAAAAAYVFLPVVMNAAHEAKPHLPGAVLILLAIISATKYLETGWPRWWLTTGALCGAATGMVLTSAVALLVIPLMVILRRHQPTIQRIGIALGAAGVAVGVYFFTNPYVLFNLFGNRELLASNLGNTADMYSISLGGIFNAIRLIALGTSPLLAALALVAGITLIAWRWRGQPVPSGDGIAWLLLVPAAAVFIQFALLASGKPAEYARFALLPGIALMILVAWAIATVAPDLLVKQVLTVVLVAVVLPYGLAYSRAFLRDTRQVTTRLQAAQELTTVGGRIFLYREPAPYNCPPVNIFRRDLILVPDDRPPQAARPDDLLLYPVDVPIHNVPDGPMRLPFREAPGSLDQFTTPITWANKTFAHQFVQTIPQP